MFMPYFLHFQNSSTHISFCYSIIKNSLAFLLNLIDKIQLIINLPKQLSLKYNFLSAKKAPMLTYYSNHARRDTTGHSTSLSSNRKKVRDFSYHPSDKIGKGFSSVVYKGTNDNTNEVVAIKAIDMKGVKDAISRQMLDCQIEALTTLKHDCVLKCFEVVREHSHCYIITEFCNQGDLSVHLKKKKRLNEEQTVKILKDIVDGFVEIGDKGFLHRDLKLANIFMHQNTAKIADFGFAKKNRFNSEREKYNVGSPLYMSPQALKKNIYSLKNDIWSIGVMAYELLHGETPWECKTEKELIDKMTRIPVRFRESLKISEPLKDFIKKCLEVDEKKRMSLDDLKYWLNGGKISSNTAGEVYPLGVKQENLPPKLNLSHKPISNIDKLSYGNTEVPDRISSRSHRHAMSNKQNFQNRSSGLGVVIPKSMVEKNNTILVNQINTFRLMYKLYQKITKKWPEETEITKNLAKEVLKRVTSLKECCDKSKNDYGINLPEKYFDEKQNPNIKKYKSVVGEYFKKYTSEIKTDSSPQNFTLKEELKTFLMKRSGSFVSEDELMIGYWGAELMEVTRETTKQKLDGIIEPKIKLNKSYVQQRIKDIAQ